MKRAKQRNVSKPNYMLRLDRRQFFPRLPRVLIYKYAPGGVRPVLDTIFEDNNKEDKKMGFFERIDAELQKDLITFVETQEAKSERGEKSTLSDVIRADIVKKIIEDDCRITGSATDHSKKIMWVEFTFYSKEAEDEEEHDHGEERQNKQSNRH